METSNPAPSPSGVVVGEKPAAPASDAKKQRDASLPISPVEKVTPKRELAQSAASGKPAEAIESTAQKVTPNRSALGTRPDLEKLLEPKLRGTLAKLDPEMRAVLLKDLDLDMQPLLKSPIEPPTPHLTFKVDKVMVAGSPLAGREIRPKGPEPPLQLVPWKPGESSPPNRTSVENPKAASISTNTSTDATTTGTQLRSSRTFYRQGFSAVGLLSDGNVPYCSAVLLNQRWALTAAHCVFDMRANGPVRRPSGPSAPSGKEWFHTLKAGEEQAYFVDPQGQRRLNPAAVEWWLIEDAQHHPGWKGLGWLDVALLRLTPRSALKEPEYPNLAPVPFGARMDITVAAYGNTSSTRRAVGGMLEVGWQQAEFASSEPLSFHWHYGFSATPNASTCLMDSGGPIYAGIQQGYLQETHVLVGIVSGMRTRGAQWISKVLLPDEACRGGQAINVRTDTADTKDWICESTGKSALGCSRS